MRRHVGFGVEGGGQTADCYGRLIVPVDISQPARVLFKMLMNWGECSHTRGEDFIRSHASLQSTVGEFLEKSSDVKA